MARDRSFNMDPIKISFGGGRASRKASNLGAVIFGCRILGNCSTNAFDATKAIFLIVHNNLSLNPFRLAGRRRRRHRKEQSEWPVENESTERPRLFDAARKRAELTGERVSPDVRRMVFEPIFYASLEPIFCSEAICLSLRFLNRGLTQWLQRYNKKQTEFLSIDLISLLWGRHV